MMSRRARLALRIAVVVAVGALLWLFLREVDGDQLLAAFRGARLWPLVPAVAIAFFMLWCSAASLSAMLAPKHVVSTPRLFRYTIAAYAGSVIAPARAGELVRVWLLKRRDGVPAADSAAVVVAQKFIDGVTMLVVIAPVTWLVPSLPSWVGRAIALGGVLALAGFLALYLAYGYVARRAQASWLSRFIAGMHVLRRPAALLRVIGALIAAWLADLVMVALVLYAVDIDLPLGHAHLFA